MLMAEATACFRDLLASDGNRLYEPVRLRLEAGLFITPPTTCAPSRAGPCSTAPPADCWRTSTWWPDPQSRLPHPRSCNSRSWLANRDRHGGCADPVHSALQYFRIPAISVPCGFSSEGLPIGLQLAGRPFDEETVLRAAHAYEQSTDWHTRRPPV